MTAESNLDLSGDFRTHPFAELVVEIVKARLSGSLRASRNKHKIVIYFREGEVVYAVSNAREHRLFSVMLNRKKIDQKTLAKFSNLANDLELATQLRQQKIFSKQEMEEIVVLQIESIIIDAVAWQSGEWHFSPLTRLRSDLIHKIDLFGLLVDYARCLPSQEVYQRFRSVREAFSRDSQPRTAAILQPHESYALDHFNNGQLTIEELRSTCSLPETAMVQSLYVLWLGGFLNRRDWNAAFSTAKIGEIRGAKVSRVKAAGDLSKLLQPVVETPAAPEPEKVPELQLSLEEYLDRVERAETLYDVLGVDEHAKAAVIKNTYFGLAKLFHPARFHREEASKLRRLQAAFTQIAHAYETLKSDDSREGYNFKLKKEADFRKRREAAAESDPSKPEDRQAEHGLGSFEQAMEALNEEEFAAAAGHLARAVHYSPQNALYHGYFGFALSKLEKQHHKAEASLQTAVKLDPKNPKIRMMLVDFFLDMKMTKRAEGELKRFLELVPDNKEAARKLEKLAPRSEI